MERFLAGERTNVWPSSLRDGAELRFLGHPGRPCHCMVPCCVLAETMPTAGTVLPFATVA